MESNRAHRFEVCIFVQSSHEREHTHSNRASGTESIGILEEGGEMVVKLTGKMTAPHLIDLSWLMRFNICTHGRVVIEVHSVQSTMMGRYQHVGRL